MIMSSVSNSRKYRIARPVLVSCKVVSVCVAIFLLFGLGEHAARGRDIFVLTGEYSRESQSGVTNRGVFKAVLSHDGKYLFSVGNPLSFPQHQVTFDGADIYEWHAEGSSDSDSARISPSRGGGCSSISGDMVFRIMWVGFYGEPNHIDCDMEPYFLFFSPNNINNLTVVRQPTSESTPASPVREISFITTNGVERARMAFLNFTNVETRSLPTTFEWVAFSATVPGSPRRQSLSFRYLVTNVAYEKESPMSFVPIIPRRTFVEDLRIRQGKSYLHYTLTGNWPARGTPAFNKLLVKNRAKTTTPRQRRLLLWYLIGAALLFPAVWAAVEVTKRIKNKQTK